MEPLVLQIPHEVIDALRFPPGEVEQELRKELAVGLYARGALSFGKARALSGLTRWELEALLAERGVVRHYSTTDLAEHLRYARGS